MSDDTAYSRIGFFKNRPFLPPLSVKITALQVALATLFFSAANAGVLLPPDVAALAAKLKVNDPIVAWCKGDFNPKTTGAYAIAVSSSKTGGRYLVIEPNAQVYELGDYSGRADLACYTPSEANALSKALAASESIHGGVEPKFSTTVVCGFLEATAATCWQFSPAQKTFVKVGFWVT